MGPGSGSARGRDVFLVVLEVLANGVVADAKGSLRKKRDLSLDGVAGMEIIADVPGTGVLKGRVYVVGNRCYHIVAGMPTSKESSDDVRDFLDSFKIFK